MPTREDFESLYPDDDDFHLIMADYLSKTGAADLVVAAMPRIKRLVIAHDMGEGVLDLELSGSFENKLGQIIGIVMKTLCSVPVDHDYDWVKGKSLCEAIGLEIFPIISEPLTAYAAEHPRLLAGLPLEFQSPAIVEACLTKEPALVAYANPDVLTQAMADFVFNSDPALINQIPSRCHTRAMVLEIAHRSPMLIGAFKFQMIDYDAAKIAVGNDEEAICMIPKNLIDAEISLMVVKKDPHALRHIPMKLRDAAICRFALEQTLDVIRYIPEEHLDAEICMSAVLHDVKLLRSVPRTILNNEICLKAVQKDPSGIKYIPIGMIDEEIKAAAGKYDDQNNHGFTRIVHEMLNR